MAPHNRSALFAASCIALIVTAMSFAVRGDIMSALESQFHLSKTQLGLITSTAFWGFTLAMMIGGPFCDVVGMKRLVVLAFVGHLAGILVTIFANGFAMLYVGTLLIGIANGFVEAACNPLVATIYPDQKTKKLNQFHVWFPGGVVIGALLVYWMSQLEVDWTGMGVQLWQVKMATMALPLLVYGVMFLPQKLPVTERRASGVTARQMFAECLRPLFILMLLCMLLTASTELGPNQWMPNIIGFTAAVSGILVVAWIHCIMAVGRQFAGLIVHRISPSGVLFLSAILSCAGLVLLSMAHGRFAAFGAATVFALGVCYFWPTMLGFVAERLPRTGALGLSTMGGAGMLAVAIVLPVMGDIYDHHINDAIPANYTRDQLVDAAPETPEAEVWAETQAVGGAATLLRVAALPAILIVVFGIIYIRDRKSGGYKAQHLIAEDVAEQISPVAGAAP